MNGHKAEKSDRGSRKRFSVAVKKKIIAKRENDIRVFDNTICENRLSLQL